MITVRRSADRGHFDHGWLDTRHTFSFADYYDPEQMAFRSLRVINEDRIAPGQGFGMHPHRDMEIVTYIVEGALAHRDSLGNGSTICRGRVQRMSAGSGIRHSEFNASDTHPVHLLQIWLLPDRLGIAPGYEEKELDLAQSNNELLLVASPDRAGGSMEIHQDVKLYCAQFTAGYEKHYALGAGRGAWIQLIRGKLKLNNTELSAGDGAAIENESDLQLLAVQESELLLFDLR